MDAVRAVFEFASQFRGLFSWKQIEAAYKKIVFDAKSYDHRIKLNAEFVKERFGEDVPVYHKDFWFSQVFKALDEEDDLWIGDVLVEKGVKYPAAKGELKGTHWYEFQQAAKSHLALALELVSDL